MVRYNKSTSEGVPPVENKPTYEEKVVSPDAVKVADKVVPDKEIVNNPVPDQEDVLEELTPEEQEALERRKKRFRLLRRILVSLLSLTLVLAIGVFSFLYWIRPPVVEIDESKTSGYKLKEWNEQVNAGVFSNILEDDAIPYMSLEFSYAGEDEVLNEFLKLVYSKVKYDVPDVQRETIWGKPAFNSSGEPVMGVGDLDLGKEYGLIIPDWSAIKFTTAEIDAAKSALGLDPQSSLLPEEDNKTLFIYVLLNKLKGEELGEGGTPETEGEAENPEGDNPESSEATEQKPPAVEPQEKATTESKSLSESLNVSTSEAPADQEQPAGGTDITSVDNDFLSGVELPEPVDNFSDEGFPLMTIMHTPGLKETSTGVWRVTQDEDIFLNNALFASKDFNTLVLRFQQALAGEEEIYTPQWLEWSKLPELQRSEATEPEKFIQKYSFPLIWIGAYQMQNPSGGNSEAKAIIPKQGTGTVDDPASLETPIKTVQVVTGEDNKKVEKQIHVNMVSFKEGQEALNWFESKDTRNRGLSTQSRMKYYGYEIEVTNLSDVDLTVKDNTDLVDVNVNSLGRTGTMYGMNDTVVLKPGESGIIETWGMTTSPQRAYLIWGKDFQRTYEPVWFRVLAGNVEKEK